jgi:hypothetical protein
MCCWCPIFLLEKKYYILLLSSLEDSLLSVHISLFILVLKQVSSVCTSFYAIDTTQMVC